MKRKLTALVLIAILLGSAGVVGHTLLHSKGKKAELLVIQVCNGASREPLTYQDRANLATQAYHLDSKWLRLSDAVNAMAGFERLTKDKSAWIYASGNDGAALYYEKGLMYAQLVAECSVLDTQ